jgi:hypothetical protein
MQNEPVQPELQFFADPAIDRLLGVVFNLAGEVQVLRDRLQILEAVLEQQHSIAPGAVNAHTASAQLQASLEAERAAYVKNLFDPMLGLAASRSVTGVCHGA